jgi:amino acid permease
MSAGTLFRKKPIAEIQRDAEMGFGVDHDPSAVDREPHLRRTLGVVDLTAFGIAAIIGAGIFSTIGGAAYNGGPAVAFLFVFTAIACAFSALCYAEFASRVPISGSAYTYAYASFGELVAWIIGWDLLIEYAIGNIAGRDLLERLFHRPARQHAHPGARRRRHRSAGLDDDGLSVRVARLSRHR